MKVKSHVIFFMSLSTAELFMLGHRAFLWTGLPTHQRVLKSWHAVNALQISHFMNSLFEWIFYPQVQTRMS